MNYLDNVWQILYYGQKTKKGESKNAEPINDYGTNCFNNEYKNEKLQKAK